VFLSATFVFEPLFDPRIASRHHLMHLIVFLVTAVVAARIGYDARRATEALAARHRESEALYGFSRRLMNLSTPAAIRTAMREHLATELGNRLVLVAPGDRTDRRDEEEPSDLVPASVLTAMRRALDGGAPEEGTEIVSLEEGTTWLVRPLHPAKSALGLIAVDIGAGNISGIDARQHVEATLRDTVARLQRLDVEQALDEAKLRKRSEELREALIGSVTHDLRTPIATVMGSATVLSKAPTIAADDKLSGLARLITTAAGDLDQKISNLINATRISSAGVKAHLAWVDPTDIVIAAVRESEASLTDHKVTRVVPGELPLVETDPVLIKEVVRQLLDNAAKYAPSGTEITVRFVVHPSQLDITVEDRGTGMSPSEIAHAFERFYRGPSQIGKSTGTGIGLWIAQALAMECGAEVRIESGGSGGGSGAGTKVSVVLPLRAVGPEEELGSDD
jgi:two-component system, OmpR family, sensor histidine kinase KdpD